MKIKFKDKKTQYAFECVYMDYYWDCIYDMFLDNIYDEMRFRKADSIIDVNYDKKYMILDTGEVLRFNECV